MELAIVAWLMDIIPSIGTVTGLSATLTGILSVFGAACLVCIWGDVHRDLAKGDSEAVQAWRFIKGVYKLILCMFFVSLVTTVLTPSRDGMKLIVGAYLAQTTYEKVVTIDGIEQLPENVVKYMNSFFEEVNKQEEEE